MPASSAAAHTTGAITGASVTMYSTQWCGYCHRLRAGLDSAGIDYHVVDIERAVSYTHLTLPTIYSV